MSIDHTDTKIVLHMQDNLGKDFDMPLFIRGTRRQLRQAAKGLVGMRMEIPAETILERITREAKETPKNRKASDGSFNFMHLLMPFDGALCLGLNEDNRTMYNSRLLTLARSLLEGNGSTTSQGIGFIGLKDFYDGQYRSLAVVLTNTPLETSVVAGLSEKARFVTDKGSTRTAVDQWTWSRKHDKTLSDEKLPAGNELAAITHLIWDVWGNHPSNWPRLNNQVYLMAKYWEKDLIWIKPFLSGPAKRLLRYSAVRAAFVIAHRKYPEAAEEILSALGNPYGEDAPKPALPYATKTYQTLHRYLAAKAGLLNQFNNNNLGATDGKHVMVWKICYLIKAYADEKEVVTGALTTIFGGREGKNVSAQVARRRLDAQEKMEMQIRRHFADKDGNYGPPELFKGAVQTDLSKVR